MNIFAPDQNRMKLNVDEANFHLVLKGFLFSIWSEFIGFSSFHRPPKVWILLRSPRLQVQRSIKQSSEFLFSFRLWPLLVLFHLIQVSIFVSLPIVKWNVDIYDIHLRLDLFLRDFFFFVRFPSSSIFQFNEMNGQGCRRHSLPLKRDND